MIDVDAYSILDGVNELKLSPKPPQAPSPSRNTTTSSGIDDRDSGIKVSKKVCPGARGARRAAKQFMKTIGEGQWDKDDGEWLKDKKKHQTESPPRVVVVGAGTRCSFSLFTLEYTL